MTKVFIIAEAGVNHNGSLELAMKLVDIAVDAGADAVKFQTFKAENLVVKRAQKAEYQKGTTNSSEPQYQMLKRLELSEVAHENILRYCQQKGIMFLSTPFDLESIDFLDRLGMPIFKIPSGEITNLPYLRRIAGKGKEIILSTGMSNLDEIGDALSLLMSEPGVSKEKITVLHATTEYPCPIDEVNISAMNTIRSEFGVRVGYSDHTEGIEIPIAAVALGATVIEKHFTLDRKMDGPDHLASLNPEELKLMIKCIRNVELAFGNGVKQPSKSEIKNINVIRKSIVALRDIVKGEIFSEANITAKRAGGGISPMRWEQVLGEIAQRNFFKDELIEL